MILDQRGKFEMIRVFTAFAFVLVCSQLLPSEAFAQDLSMCTASFPVACCKQSYAKYGPFGTLTGAAREARNNDMRVCVDRLAKKKSR
ncbi:hypothetical protein XI03_00810 [Bradyrhizobium sp. CCBAU 65884]|nr:hypothetical protein [Bradyrhizobium sp. CCBAU 65884]